jgi:hypothetical protein
VDKKKKRLGRKTMLCIISNFSSLLFEEIVKKTKTERNSIDAFSLYIFIILLFILVAVVK